MKNEESGAAREITMETREERTEKSRRRDEIRKEYIENTVKNLRSFRPTGEEEHNVSKYDDRYLHSCSPDKVIPILSGGWIYCIGHSFHDDGIAEKNIGDINMAIDHEGNLYINEGHLCVGITFWSNSEEGLDSIDDVYKEQFPKQKRKWRLYRPEE